MSLTIYSNDHKGKGGISIKQGKRAVNYKFFDHSQMISEGISLITLGVRGAYSVCNIPHYLKDENDPEEIVTKLVDHVTNEIYQDCSLYSDIENSLENTFTPCSSSEFSDEEK